MMELIAGIAVAILLTMMAAIAKAIYHFAAMLNKVHPSHKATTSLLPWAILFTSKVWTDEGNIQRHKFWSSLSVALLGAMLLFTGKVLIDHFR